MMKRIVLLLFGTIAFSACSDGVPAETVPGESGKRHFLTVGITGSVTTRAAETPLSDLYEPGSDSEDKINSLRFYFFDDKGEPADIGIAGKRNYVNCTKITPETGTSQPNAQKRMLATVAVNVQDEHVADIGSLVAVANHEAAELGTGALSLAELCAKVGDYGAVEKAGTGGGTIPNILMTSSSYAGTDGPICTTPVKPEHLCETEEEAAKNPITVYMERAVAKTRLKTVWNAETAVVEGVAYDGKTWTAVKLKDGDGNALKIDGKQAYAIFTGWNVTSKADRSHLFKKVNTETAWQLGWAWNHPAYFRSYWAANPAGTTLGHIAYDAIDLEVGENSAAYCMENAADDFDNGTKRPYDPDKEICNRTQAIIAAVLVTIGPDNKASAADLAKWGGGDYTEEGVKSAMLSMEAGLIFTKEETAGTVRFVPIRPEHVRLVTGAAAGMADDKSENSPRYLSYLQLTDEAKALQFYSDADDDAALTPEEVDALLKNIPGAKVWKNGMTYYYMDIRHSGSDEEKGLYGVVRNHLYEVDINSVVGLGTPVYDPAEKIVPQKPDNEETYIAAKINVLSWRVAGNDFDFEW